MKFMSGYKKINNFTEILSINCSKNLTLML